MSLTSQLPFSPSRDNKEKSRSQSLTKQAPATFENIPVITVQPSCGPNWACSKSQSQGESLAPPELTDLTAFSDVSSCSNISPSYPGNLKIKPEKQVKNVLYAVPEKCMYILWDRDPKGKYSKINEYDFGENYVWYDELFQRLKAKRSKDEFDDINRIAVTYEVLEAVDKVERNYFLGISDGSVIKISDKLYVWRVDVSHIEDEIILGPKVIFKPKSNVYPRVNFRPCRRLLRLYNFFRRRERYDYRVQKSISSIR